MTDKQPEALRLADALTTPSSFQFSRWDVAAELRRLHEVNAELVDALKKSLYGLKFHTSQTGSLLLTNRAMQVVETALRKAQGDNK